MNTNTENQTIYRLKKEVSYWQTMAKRYAEKIEDVRDLKENLNTCQKDIEFLKAMLADKHKLTSVQEHIEITLAEFYPFFIPSMIKSKSRKREVVELRHIWMSLMYKYAGLSLCNIGKASDRDHSTILHAVHKVNDICTFDKAYAATYDLIRKSLVKKLESTKK